MPAMEEEEQPACDRCRAGLGAIRAPAQSVTAGEPPDEPVPGYPPDPEEDQETVSAFAPPDRRPASERWSPMASRIRGVRGGRSTFRARRRPQRLEPPEAAAQPAEVSDLEKEMARLLDEISTSRRE